MDFAVKILVVGGDERQKVLTEELKNKGFDCMHFYSSFDFSQIERSKIIVLPVPLSKDGEYIFSDNSDFKVRVKDFLSHITKRHILIFGSASKRIKEMLDERGFNYYDLFSEESFVVNNAYYTAQGALLEILKNTKEYIVGRRVLILGFGRVGRAVANILDKNGMQVFVAARNPVQLANCEGLGYGRLSYDELKTTIYLFDYIISTVPFNVLSSFEVSHISDNALFIELASAPYSAKRESFSEFNKRYILASGLPGKYLSVESGKKIAEIIERYIS